MVKLYLIISLLFYLILVLKIVIFNRIYYLLISYILFIFKIPFCKLS